MFNNALWFIIAVHSHFTLAFWGIVFFQSLFFAFLTHMKNRNLKQHIREARYVTVIKCTGPSACIELQLIIFYFSLIDSTSFLHYYVGIWIFHFCPNISTLLNQESIHAIKNRLPLLKPISSFPIYVWFI